MEQLVTEYYDFYFNGVQPYPSSQKETLRKNLSTMEKRRGTELTQIHDKVEKLIKGLGGTAHGIEREDPLLRLIL